MLGFAVALARLSSRRALVYPARFYVSLIRGTPLLVQLFIIYYGLPDFGVILSPIPAALNGPERLTYETDTDAVASEMFEIHDQLLGFPPDGCRSLVAPYARTHSGS
jgi:hypothetical protein